MPLAPTRHMTTDTMFTASTQTLKFMAAALWLSGGIVLVYKGSVMLLAAQAAGGDCMAGARPGAGHRLAKGAFNFPQQLQKKPVQNNATAYTENMAGLPAWIPGVPGSHGRAWRHIIQDGAGQLSLHDGYGSIGFQPCNRVTRQQSCILAAAGTGKVVLQDGVPVL
jgi:hypothetical protein